MAPVPLLVVRNVMPGSLSRSVVLVLLLLGCALGTALAAEPPPRPWYWSDPATWLAMDEDVPTPGATVTIPQGFSVWLDVDTPPLRELRIQGQLIVLSAPGGGLRKITTDVLKVSGLLQAGSKYSPYPGRLRIELTSTTSTYVADNTGRDFHVLPGGTLELHGRAKAPSWTRLAATATAGADHLVLEDPVTWQPGDRIVVASTDYAFAQAEELTITSVSADGRTVYFGGTLQYRHEGATYSGVDQHAEVGLLSRDIVITSPNVAQDKGGHLMAMATIVPGRAPGAGTITNQPTVNLSWVEFEHMGREGELGRYPLHFHMCGNMAGRAEIRSCSVHHSFHGGIVVHRTQGVLVEENVVFDTRGHAFYLEANGRPRIKDPEDSDYVAWYDQYWSVDPGEAGDPIALVDVDAMTHRPRDNVFVRNLGLVTRDLTCQPLDQNRKAVPSRQITWFGYKPFLDDWKLASTFYIADPANTFTGNVAAGSADYGFWCTIKHKRSGTHGGQPWTLDPPHDFTGNVAHSNGRDGFNQRDGRATWSSTATYANFRSYRNRRSAIWYRSYGTSLWSQARIADCGRAVYFASEGHPYTANPDNFSWTRLVGATVVGKTANVGNPSHANELAIGRSLPYPTDPTYEITAFDLYDGKNSIESCLFRDFVDDTVWDGSNWVTRTFAVFVPLRGTPTRWWVDPRSFVQGTTFQNARQAWLQTSFGDSGWNSTLLYDVDGSLTGTANSYLITDSPLLRPLTGRTPHPEWNQAAVIPGPPTNEVLGFTLQEVGSVNGSPALMIYPRNPRAPDLVERSGAVTGNRQAIYHCNLLSRDEYEVFFWGRVTPLPKRFWLRLHHGPPQASAIFGVEFPYDLGYTVTVTRDQQPLVRVSTLQAVRDDPAGAKFYLGGGKLWVKLKLGGWPSKGTTTLDGTHDDLYVNATQVGGNSGK